MSAAGEVERGVVFLDSRHIVVPLELCSQPYGRSCFHRVNMGMKGIGEDVSCAGSGNVNGRI